MYVTKKMENERDVDEKEAVLNLCNAIIERACNDYENDKTRVTQFFRSPWYEMLSRGKVDGETVIKFLESGERKPLYVCEKEK